MLASLASDLTFAACFLFAEMLVVFSTWSQVALDLYSRSRLLELTPPAARPRVEARLDRSGVYQLSVRIARFVGSALLVAGIALLTLHDKLGASGSSAAFPWGPLGLTLAITFLVSFLVNDLLVRHLASRRPNRFLLRALPWLSALTVVTAPIRWPLARLFRWILRVRLEEPAPSAREEVLESVEEGEREGSLSAHEADMIESIIDLGELTVDDVLTPRGEVATIRADATLHDAVRYVLEHGHRRLPVYGRDRDDVVGVIHAFDILRELSQARPRARVREIMRPPYFVPEGKPLNDLLNEMRDRRVSMAIVMNEYGGVAGLVTIADVLEEIVGEIEDEHDLAEEPPPTPGKDGTLLVEGRTSLEELNEMLSLSLPVDQDYETVGGLVFHRMGKVPRAGDRVTVENVALTVTDADERTVKRVRVEVLSTPHGA